MATGTVQAGYGYFNSVTAGMPAAKAESSMFFAERLLRCVEEADAPAGAGRIIADVGEEADASTDETVIMDYQEFFQNKINEIYEKVQNGETEPSFQIGAQSFTEKEWDEFLEKFDAFEEAMRELMQEEHVKRAAEQLKKQQEAAEDQSSLLLAESTSCVYPPADAKKEDVRYITWYAKEGIICRKMGETEDEWSVPFTDESQYDKVMEFIGQFPSDWNMRFAAHENFWTDFLKNGIDLDSFMEFMKGTDHGVPDYSVTAEDGSMYIDRDKLPWAKYLNSFGNRLYTREEFQKMWEMGIRKK